VIGVAVWTLGRTVQFDYESFHAIAGVNVPNDLYGLRHFRRSCIGRDTEFLGDMMGYRTFVLRRELR
jgi:hypothetical protein